MGVLLWNTARKRVNQFGPYHFGRILVHSGEVSPLGLRLERCFGSSTSPVMPELFGDSLVTIFVTFRGLVLKSWSFVEDASFQALSGDDVSGLASSLFQSFPRKFHQSWGFSLIINHTWGNFLSVTRSHQQQQRREGHIMEQTYENQHSKQHNDTNEHDAWQDMLRRLSQLKKTVGRLVRRAFSSRDQYPDIFSRIEQDLERLRAWIRAYRDFWRLPAFQHVLNEGLQSLHNLIRQIQKTCQPDVKPGKRQKSRLWQTYRKQCRALEKMLTGSPGSPPASTFTGRIFEVALEGALRTALARLQPDLPAHMTGPVSQRGERTIVFPCGQLTGYHEMVRDARRFRHDVLEPLEQLMQKQGHGPCCHASPHYKLIGYRAQSRKPVVSGGQQVEVPIRMIQCTTCDAKFSLLPSFLAREKHVALDIIGHIVRKLTLCEQSLQSTLLDLEMLIPGGHSKQTLLDWVAWFGTLHPATILTRAGVSGTGYFQEDEGVEKEAGLRTYTVAMVEPATLLVWHLDYVDHVDAETLTASFEAFVKQIDFSVFGVTKDKWLPSTQALKQVFHGLWIAFCHRHELKKWRQAFAAYQEAVQCTVAERQRLYQRLKTVLDRAESGTVLRLKLRGLEQEEAAFRHPILQVRLTTLQANAARYTCHHKRHGLTKTTSIVDNFLKNVKRKLRQVESFRDQTCTRTFFRAMATVRNFVPFFPGAKNAHHSPFMLAQGETYDVPWAQVMNIHNAFVFTANAC